MNKSDKSKKVYIRGNKKQAQEYFDKIWHLNLLKRGEAHKWLSEMLEITDETIDFGKMNFKTLKDATFFCVQALNDNRRLDRDFGVDCGYPYYEIID